MWEEEDREHQCQKSEIDSAHYVSVNKISDVLKRINHIYRWKNFREIHHRIVYTEKLHLLLFITIYAIEPYLKTQTSW